MRLSRRLLAPALAATLGTSAALGLATAPSAHAGTPVSLTGFHQLIVDKAAGYIFLSEGVDSGSLQQSGASAFSSSGLMVADLAGNLVATVDAGDGVEGIALSPDGTELYVALASQDKIAAIDVSTIAQSRPAQTFYPLGTGDVPYDVAVQSGKVWISYNTPPIFGAIGDITPGTTTSFEADPTLVPASRSSWYSAPDLAADPSDSGTVVAAVSGITPTPVASLSVSGTAAVLVGSTTFGCYDNDLAVLPGGSEFIMPCDSSSTPGVDTVFSTADLSAQSLAYPAVVGVDGGPISVAVSPDGAVATGSRQLLSYGQTAVPDTFTYAPGETSPRNPYTLGAYGPLARRGLAWAADDSLLAAVTGNSSGTGPFFLHVFTNPLLTASTISLGGTSTANPTQAISLSGTLAFRTGAPPAGTSVTITRTLAGSSAAPASFTITTAPDGSFSFSDSALPAGIYTYTASYAGDSVTEAASASHRVTVALGTSDISMNFPTSIQLGKGISPNGTLEFGTGTPATGTPISVKRKNPDGTTTTLASVQTAPSGSFEDFTFSDKPPAVGTYTYTVSYAGDATTASATATYKLTVTKLTPKLTITTGASTALYDSTIKVTAHLGNTDTNRTVSVYAQLVGTGTRKLLKTATVNSSGNLAISYPRATRNVIFTATFGGDAKYLARSVSARVGVDVRVSMAESGWCGSTKYDGATYQVFNGGNVNLECYSLNLAVNFTPAKPGETLELETEQWYDNMWTTEFTSALDFSINANPMEVTLVMPPLTTSTYFRLRAVFVPGSKDVTNVSYYSGWFYFEVEK